MKIVNIGSSFSAGPGVYPLADSKAGRSQLNFAHLLAKHLEAELIDLSVSGATLLNMLCEPQIAHGHKFLPQVQEVPHDADIVLVLGGGNDMHYISDIIAETWVGWLVMQSLRLIAAISGTENLPADEATVCQRYGTLLDAVHAKAPQARIIVIEYLTVFGSDAKHSSNVPCGSERVEHHQAVATRLRTATNEAADQRQPWCEVLHTAQLSETHGMSSQSPWVFGLDLATLMRREAWAHPNADGMRAVAKMLVDKMTN